jgi:hypothetical protein
MTKLIELDIKNIIDICNNTPYKLDDNLKYVYYKIKPNFKLQDNIKLEYHIIKKKLNINSNIPLYVIVGLSNNSLCNNLLVLNNNIDKIKDIYSEIIFLIFDKNIKNKHKEFIKINENNDEFNNYTDKEDKHNAINDKMKSIIAKHHSKIIKNINKISNYKYIDVLGVSFGGGVLVFLSQNKSIKVRKLILMAPAIFEGFKNLSKKQNIILGWCIQDTKILYDTHGKRLINDLKDFSNKTIILTDLGQNEPNEDITHRLQNGLFDVVSID